MDAKREPLRVAVVGAGGVGGLVHPSRPRQRGASLAPELDRVLGLLVTGDMLTITRLDRLSRSVQHLINLGATLRARGVGLHVIEQGIDTQTMEGRAMFGMLAVLAELQREHHAPRSSRQQRYTLTAGQPCAECRMPIAKRDHTGRADGRR